MKRRVLRLLDRAGLVAPAFRVYERIVSLRPGRAPSHDGPPLPPRHLMVRVAGTADADWFLRSGRAAFDTIARFVPLDDLGDVLDFGCGCGRVTRYWDGYDCAVAGSDTNGDAIDWCRRNLPFASFERNRLEPPLDFDAEAFDLVYALSVFTHLTAELQTAWRDELRRVVRPGGLVLLTTHGRSYVPRLDDDERARFEQGELVVRWGDVPGTNLCSAYHPEAYVRDTLAAGFTLLRLEPEGAHGNPTQDLVLLRRD